MITSGRSGKPGPTLLSLLLVALTAVALSGCGGPAGPFDLSRAETGRPSTLTGPAPTAGPLLTITDLPGYSCGATRTLTPRLVVYDDGYVLAADHRGGSCEPVPAVQVGWVNPEVVRSGANRFFAGREARVDMSTLPVYDLGSVQVGFAGPGGARTVSAYGLDSTEQVPDDQRDARAALRALVDQARTLGGSRSPWPPTRLSVVRTYGPVRNPARLTWPLPVTPAWAAFFAGPPESCREVTGADAAALLRAHGSAVNEAVWTAGTRSASLALGVVLPGFPTCPALR